jgi:hypothetical protein
MKTPFLCSIIIVLLYGCSKIAEPNYRKLDPQIRRAATFKEGSYFVYKDSATATLDCFWVYRFTAGNNGPGELIQSYLRDTQDNHFLAMSGLILSSKPILYGHFHDCFTELVSLPFEENTKQERAYNLKHYPNLLVNGMTYEDVYETFTFKKMLIGRTIHYLRSMLSIA